MIRSALTFCLFWATTIPVAAESILAGISRETLDITTTFDGSELLVFGAVRRETPLDNASNLEVIVVLEGPSRPVVVRRMDRRFGIWVNVDSIEVDEAPAFYSVATTAPFGAALSATEDSEHEVSVGSAVRNASSAVDHQDAFIAALLRIRAEQSLYQINENAIMVSDDTLFQTVFQMPANLAEGVYQVHAMLTRDGEVVDTFTQEFAVQKTGLQRAIYDLAHEWPLAYGILSLVIAIAAGWLASTAFRRSVA